MQFRWICLKFMWQFHYMRSRRKLSEWIGHAKIGERIKTIQRNDEYVNRRLRQMYLGHVELWASCLVRIQVCIRACAHMDPRSLCWHISSMHNTHKQQTQSAYQQQRVVYWRAHIVRDTYKVKCCHFIWIQNNQGNDRKYGAAICSLAAYYATQTIDCKNRRA